MLSLCSVGSKQPESLVLHRSDQILDICEPVVIYIMHSVFWRLIILLFYAHLSYILTIKPGAVKSLRMSTCEVSGSPRPEIDIGHIKILTRRVRYFARQHYLYVIVS